MTALTPAILATARGGLLFRDDDKYDLSVSTENNDSQFYVYGLRDDPKRAVEVSANLRAIELLFPVRVEFIAFCQDKVIAQIIALDGCYGKQREEVQSHLRNVEITWKKS